MVACVILTQNCSLKIVWNFTGLCRWMLKQPVNNVLRNSQSNGANDFSFQPPHLPARLGLPQWGLSRR